MFRRAGIVGLLMVAGCCALYAGKPKPNPTLVKLPTMTVAIKDLEVPKPKQACPNWAWAAAVELMLARQNVDLKQTYWILKANAGELCIETPVSLNALKRTVDGDYVLLDGRQVHLEGVVTPGAPRDVGYLVGSLREGRPLMMLWQGRPMVLQSMDFDEYIYPNNQRMFEAVRLKLVDPLGDAPVVFEKLNHSMSDLGGVFEVRVGPIEHFR